MALEAGRSEHFWLIDTINVVDEKKRGARRTQNCAFDYSPTLADTVKNVKIRQAISLTPGVARRI